VYLKLTSRDLSRTGTLHEEFICKQTRVQALGMTY